jgi:hypothetical protein
MRRQESTRRGNSFAFPLPTGASIPSRLPASPSRAGYQPPPCDQGAIPPWNPRLICFPVASHRASHKSVNSEGEQPRFPPSDGSLNPIEAPCLPFSGWPSTPALRPRGHTPLEPPTDLSPRGKPRGMQQISQGDSPLMICSITVRSFLRALARWLIRFFTLGGSSAKVLDISGTRKRGS